MGARWRLRWRIDSDSLIRARFDPGPCGAILSLVRCRQAAGFPGFEPVAALGVPVALKHAPEWGAFGHADALITGYPR